MRRPVKKEVEIENEEISSEEDDADGGSIFGDEEAPTSTRTERFSKFKKIAAEFKSFRPASEVLTHVRAVPTIFVQYDHGTKVGGHPTERIALLHGPSGEGKTYFTLGQLRSFLRVDNPVFYIDAERTTDKGFATLAMQELTQHPLFFYERPHTYEEVVAKVRKWCNTVKSLRESKKLDPDACGLVVVDSIRKMVPEDQWNRILKLQKAAQQGEKKEKLRDRSAQIKAMMNAAWCDELVPLLEQTGCTAIIIARETDDPDADQRSKMFGNAFKVGGGKALYYDASLDIRIERAKYVQKDNGEGQRPTVYGERHRITIRKSKVAGKDDKTIICYFHTSNGNLIGPGFDRARDVLELARRPGFDVVKTKQKKGMKKAGGGWMTWGDHRWQGEHKAVEKLTADPKLLAKLEAAVRAKFETAKPIEVSEDGEVLE